MSDTSLIDRLKAKVAAEMPERPVIRGPSATIESVTELLLSASEAAPKLLDDDRSERFRAQARMVLERFDCVTRARSARRAANRCHAVQRALRSLLTTLQWGAPDEWIDHSAELVKHVEALDNQLSELLERERALGADLRQLRRAS
jgi:hypothetical protein